MDYKDLKLVYGVDDAELIYLGKQKEKEESGLLGLLGGFFNTVPVEFKTKAEIIKAFREQGELTKKILEVMRRYANELKEKNLSIQQLANLNNYNLLGMDLLPELAELYTDENEFELCNLAGDVEEAFNDMLHGYLVYNMVERENEQLALLYEEKLIRDDDYDYYKDYFDLEEDDDCEDSDEQLYCYININEFEWCYIEIYNMLTGSDLEISKDSRLEHEVMCVEWIMQYLLNKYAD